MATAAALGKHSSNVHQAYHDVETDGDIANTILDALEAVSGRPAERLGVCLYDSIDPDALNDLFQPTHAADQRLSGRVWFTVGSYSVTVHASGHVFVRQTG
ncbi:HalOD1 output domain-containing protein [Halorussus halophilus]|uniref:HalOD1 output domain-containing protein n=1 Tax=Halorussus halophilus TaxID=2650975 RepID=UPI0013014BC9|nr:HalOD1 output domain-containing protein [Halorussus halophilus]